LEKNIIEWVNRISEKRNELGGFSICPFAKKALEDKKVFWSYIGQYEPETYIMRYIETLQDYEIVIFFNNEKNLTNDDLLRIIKKLQKKMENVIFLKDHPDDPGFINGLNTGNQKFPVILAQPKDKLIDAREKLKKTKYYDYWSEEYKNEIWNYGNTD